MRMAGGDRCSAGAGRRDPADSLRRGDADRCRRDLWLSGQYHRDSIALHFTWRRQPEAVASACAEIERTLAPFSPRAHWGKVSGLSAVAIAESFPRLPDFLTLRDELDPSGKFLNPWLCDKLFGGR